jgi:hypothetical protein
LGCTGEPLPAFAATAGISNGDNHDNSDLGPHSSTYSHSKTFSDERNFETPRTSSDGCPSAMTLLDVPRSCFSQILLVPDMIGDHLPDAYVKALQPVVPSHLREYLTRVETPGDYN